MKVSFDKQICTPSKLTVLCMLMKGEFSFKEIKNNWGYTDGGLSTAIRDLEKAKLVRIEKSFSCKKVVTIIFPTIEGKVMLQNYASWLAEIMPKELFYKAQLQSLCVDKSKGDKQ